MLKGSIEDNVLTLLCWSDDHAASLVVQITPKLFSTRAYRRIAERAFDHIERFRTPPGAHLRDLFEDDLRRGNDDGKFLNQILSDMEELRLELQPTFVLAQLGHFIRSRQLITALEEAADLAQAGDLDAAEEALHKRQIIAQDTSSGIWLHDADKMLGFLNQVEEDFFPSGLEVFDRRGVRPARKQLFLIIGPKKSGKSWWLIEMGKQAVLHRRSVLHITLEMSEEECAKRYVQALFAMTVGKAETIRVPVFRKDALGHCTSLDFESRTPEVVNHDSRSAVMRKLSALKNRTRLLIKEFPTSALTIPQLNAYLDWLDRSENFRPDLLLVDYGDLMSIRSENVRTDTSMIFKQLRGIGVARDMAVVSATQGNRQSENARVVSSMHVAEDWSKVATADTVCTITKTPAERQSGLARILVDAARHVEDKWLALISQNYATGQFCIDSVYMNKHLETEIDRVHGERQDEE